MENNVLNKFYVSLQTELKIGEYLTSDRTLLATDRWKAMIDSFVSHFWMIVS